ncbi:MAG: hypothetical protein DI538_26340 [Azospira oryzae]|jgi:hypothetical protein|nr:hypothetical protein [Cytophaga sp.]PZR26565.1 MAG: hypothetical protein DI538_26340 [Azospira oryzae]
MNTIEIDSIIAENDFEEGKSIQIRAEANSEEKVYEKNSFVTISHRGMETRARIVSEPLLISSEKDTNLSIYSLIVQKA